MLHYMMLSTTKYAIDDFDSFLGVIIKLLTLIGLILGYSYIHTLKSKLLSAPFGYWAQIKYKLMDVLYCLKHNQALIYNLYDTGIRKTLPEVTPTTEDVKLFKNKINDLYSYLNTTSDQLPAYHGWTEDINVILEFIAQINMYDIEDPDNKFIDIQCCDTKLQDPYTYCQYICETLERSVKEINDEQKRIEEQIMR